MAKLKMLGNRIPSASTYKAKPITTAASRLTGSALQRRRLKLWTASPWCASCSRVVAYPYGFELDHLVPLWQGGADTESNCQILCVYYDEHGVKRGCHADKTAQEASERS